MKESKLIVSGYGFLSSIENLNKGEKKYIWASNVREAKYFSLKQAKNIMQTMTTECFIWAPFQEELIKGYKVVRRKNHYDIFNEIEHEVLEWIVLKANEAISDFKFLENKSNSNEPIYYSI